MAHIPQRLSRGFILAIAGILCLTMLAPAAALADTDLVIGGSARIAYANGDDVRLRDSAGYDGNVLALIPEGTVLDVLDGPIDADDGSVWYQISYNDQTGYMVSDYLAVVDTSADPQQAADAEAAVAAAAPAAPVGMAVIAGTNGDGVRCHTDANANSATITVLPEGTVVDLTGDLVDVWQPVNCGGSSGYVHSAYVSYDGSDPAGDAGVQQDQSDQSADASTSDATTFSASSVVTGTAVVTGTNGDGVRCRTAAGYDSSTITVLAEGTTVNLRGDPQGEWQPVICGGSNGFAHIDYLATGGSAVGSAGGGGDTSAAEAGNATGSATVTGTDGGGLNCRSSAGMGDNVITILPEGSTVSLRGDAQGDWQPVICGGSNGYVSVDYLSTGGGGGSSSGGGSGDLTVTGQGVVTNAGGGLRCRAGASLDSSVITVFSNGATIDLRGDASNGWIPVVCAGQAGYSSAEYVSYGDYVAPGDGGSGGSTSGGGSSSGGGASNSSLSAGSLAKVSGTNGDGVRMRSGPSYDSSTITVLPEGTVVDVTSGSTGDWVAVSYNGSNGFSHMDYLVATDGSSSGGGSSNSGGSSGDSGSGGSSDSASGYRLANGDHAEVTDYLNLRYEPSSSAGVAAVAPPGTVVEITGIPTSGYYPVNWDGLDGYMYTSWLSATNAATTSRGGSAPSSSDGGSSNGGGSSSGGSSGGSASGQAMVDFAMQYLGYPYVWATAGPGSFDCSGFTYWVALNVLGIDIGRGTDSQPNYGTPVSRDQLQPGDLVFFQNTYTWGLSHVGIYIGNGQFIHAENESTGVRISDLSSPYYSSRWYGATRLA